MSIGEGVVELQMSSLKPTGFAQRREEGYVLVPYEHVPQCAAAYESYELGPRLAHGCCIGEY